MRVFESLDITAKREILKRESVLLFAMPYYHYMIRLHSLGQSFIEEYFDTEQKKVTRISEATEQDMYKYLSKIELTDLVKH
ncbi:MAG TPA: hypothetical protein VGD40_01565 [Chryseosolibacter sp.]